MYEYMYPLRGLLTFWHICSKSGVRQQLIAMLRLHYLSHDSCILCKFFYKTTKLVIKVHSWIGLQHSVKVEN